MPWSTCLFQHLLLSLVTLAVAQEPYLITSPIPEPSTCPYRRGNYITHSLPQQCLATTRASSSTRVSELETTNSTYEADIVPISSLLDDESHDFSNETSIPAVITTATTTASFGSSILSEQPLSSIQSTAMSELRNAADFFEEDSFLGSGNFLSFEEWKKQNLKKAGQSEHVGRRNHPDSQEPRKRPAAVHNSLESLGDDGEIDIDFSGFVPGALDKSVREVSRPIADSASSKEEEDPARSPQALSRSKDAGTTCKERFNYASFDCAANVLKTNHEAKSANSVLLENKDSYMLNQCSAQNKFIILELCNDILIDTVVLANFEFFSSTFRTFRVSVSDRYPVKVEKWKTLGTYEARNSREVQAFLVENPLIWTRYVRVEFLSHYGGEFYCPVSLVRIHGTTMMEDYRHDLEMAMEDDNDEPDHTSQEDSSPVDSLTPEAVAEPLMYATPIEEEIVSQNSTVVMPPTMDHPQEQNIEEETEKHPKTRVAVPASLAAFEAISLVIESSDTCSPADSPQAYHTTDESLSEAISSYTTKPSSPPTSNTQTVSPISVPQSVSLTGATTTSKSFVPDLNKNITDLASSKLPTYAHSRIGSSQDENTTISTNATTSVSASSSSSPVSTKDKTSAVASDRPKASSTATQPHPAVPSTQESFFKSVQKRLQMLEANSSLSLQYIEDQSRALRDAFKKVEQRQLAKTTTFLDQLNQTVLSELREFRQQYDQLWQSTVIELQLQRERYERDNAAINASTLR